MWNLDYEVGTQTGWGKKVERENWTLEILNRWIKPCLKTDLLSGSSILFKLFWVGVHSTETDRILNDATIYPM